MDVGERCRDVLHRCFRNAIIIILITQISLLFALIPLIFMVTNLVFTGFLLYFIISLNLLILALPCLMTSFLYRKHKKYVIADKYTITSYLSMPTSIFVFITVYSIALFRLYICFGWEKMLISFPLSITIGIVPAYIAHRFIIWPLRELKHIYFSPSLSTYTLFDSISKIIDILRTTMMGVLWKLYSTFGKLDHVLFDLSLFDKDIASEYNELLSHMQWRKFRDMNYHSLLKSIERKYNFIFGSISLILLSCMLAIPFLDHFDDVMFLFFILLMILTSIVIFAWLFVMDNKTRQILKNLGIEANDTFIQKLRSILINLLLKIYSSIEKAVGWEIIVHDTTKEDLKKWLKSP